MNKIFKRSVNMNSYSSENRSDRYSGRVHRDSGRVDRAFGRNEPNSITDARSGAKTCFACGQRGHFKGDPACRAKKAKCLKCGELGHYANRCLKRSNTNYNSFKPKRLRLIEEEPRDVINDEVFYAMGKNTFEFIVGGIKIPMIIDSGADANVITEETWQKVSKAGIEVLGFSQEVDRNLIGYATCKPMKMSGMFQAMIRAGLKEVQATFYIVEQGQRNLLGDKTAKQLEVLKVGFDIASIRNTSVEFPKIRGVIVEIPINDSVQPVQQGYRRAPIALEGKIHEKLKSLLDKDIIEKVNGPSPWVSPMVPIMKASGEIRLCVDMRRANQAVLRESHPLPLIEELLGSLGDAVKFSKLDIKEAYHQLELSEKSREITTFITKYGLFR